MRTCTGSETSSGPTYRDLVPGDVFTWGKDEDKPAIKTGDGHVYLFNGQAFKRTHHNRKVVMYPDACVCLNGHDK